MGHKKAQYIWALSLSNIKFRMGFVNWAQLTILRTRKTPQKIFVVKLQTSNKNIEKSYII